MNRRLALPTVLLLLAAFGPSLVGTAEPPSIAATAAQRMPPGTTLDVVEVEGGGLVRAPRIVEDDDGLVVLTRGSSRTLSGMRAAGPVRNVREWLGTDHQGRSLQALLVHGTRTSLLVALVATLLALAIGTGLGLAAALAPPAARRSIEIATDALLGLPRVLLLLMLGLIFRGTPAGMGLAIGLASWMEISRLVQAEASRLRGEAFVVAARAAGAGRLRTAARHLLPNLSPILTVSAPLVATQAILLEATLSFLGIAGRGSWTSLGRIIADGQRLLPGAWWMVVFPGLLLSVTALAFHALHTDTS